MTTNNSKTKNTAAIAGSLLTGIFALTTMSATANNLIVEDLGSGAQLRTQLLADVPVQLQSNTSMELSCGEGKCGGDDKKEAAKEADVKKDSKAAEHKCGEGKCGGDEKKAATKEPVAKKESKTSESKCGEGKCGE